MPNMPISEVKKKYTSELMKIKFVNGVGTENKDGKKFIKVFVSVPNRETLKKIPKTLEGYDVEVESIGDIYPM